MTPISAIFFDIGGVLGTNGWDHVSRHRAAENFKLDRQSLEKTHAELAEALDTSAISVDDYIQKAVFNDPAQKKSCKTFKPEDFLAFMKNESQPYKESIAVAAQLAAAKKFYMATLNNESAELNNYRIDKFGLSPYFQAFFSSGYLGARKPDKLIYERAIWISHQDPAQSLFIDDREANLEIPRQLGFRTIRFVSADQLNQDLKELGLSSTK